MNVLILLLPIGIYLPILLLQLVFVVSSSMGFRRIIISREFKLKYSNFLLRRPRIYYIILLPTYIYITCDVYYVQKYIHIYRYSIYIVCVCACVCLEERRVEVPVWTPTANHISSGNDVTVNADK